jgi:hypothetical protein
MECLTGFWGNSAFQEVENTPVDTKMAAIAEHRPRRGSEIGGRLIK